MLAIAYRQIARAESGRLCAHRDRRGYPRSTWRTQFNALVLPILDFVIWYFTGPKASGG
jgi:hypothetical protein